MIGCEIRYPKIDDWCYVGVNVIHLQACYKSGPFQLWYKLHARVLAHLMCAKLQKLVCACTVAYDFGVCMLVSEYTQHKRDAHYKLALGLPHHMCSVSTGTVAVRLKYIMLLKHWIILSRNSFNFYLLLPKLFPTFYYRSMQMCYKNHNILLTKHKTYHLLF